MYTGSFFLYIYYQLKGEKTSFSNILNQNSEETGLKKYRYNAFFIGVIFWILVVLLIAWKFQ
jgi:hypothetical protein